MKEKELINIGNMSYYKKIYQAILDLENIEPNAIKITGMGIEPYFHYSVDIMEIIQKSKRITAWIINCSTKIAGDELNTYKKRDFNKGDKILYEKVEY